MQFLKSLTPLAPYSNIISGQLLNILNETPLTSFAVQSIQPFKPTASAMRVNMLWFLSLVLSLNCVLSTTLMQQWAQCGGISPKRLRRCFGFVLTTAFSSRMASHMSQFVCEWFTSVCLCCYSWCSCVVLFSLLLQARLPQIFLLW